VRLPKVEREEMRFLNPAEVAWLADVIDARYRALVLVAAYGGLRIGELAGLRRRRVDLLRGTVDVAEIVVEVRGELFTPSASRPFLVGRWWSCRAARPARRGPSAAHGSPSNEEDPAQDRAWAG
jgi:site-specific recombinase XerC